MPDTHSAAQPDKRRTLVDKTIKDRDGKVALGSLPNTPLLVWLGARLLQWPLNGTLEHFAKVIAFGALFTWAWLEIFQGVNYFRRGLGLLVLLGLILSATRHGLF